MSANEKFLFITLIRVIYPIKKISIEICEKFDENARIKKDILSLHVALRNNCTKLWPEEFQTKKKCQLIYQSVTCRL